MLSMYRGGCCLLIPNPRDIPGLIKSLTGVAFHVLPGVNTLFNALANHPAFQALDFSHLRIASGGGAAVQAAVAEHWHQVTGTTICEGYGLSETSPVVTGNPLNATCFSGNIGYPVPSTRVQIIDEAGNALATGQVGEIAVKGPQVMLGYWQRPDETARVMTPTGYLRTGDIGIMDATGAIRIVDRKKDMILVSGFNVYPNEVEDVVAMHPDVVECAVVGVPSQNTGEAVKLFVVSRSDTLSTTDLQEHCHRNLAPYKCPKQIEFRADLPKSNVGKILRRQLRDQGHESH
jgi:long-chain acyl-CoA synthetase